MRSSQSLCPCLKRQSVSVSTNSKVSTPRERDSHSASRGLVAVLPQKPSVVAWFQRCFRVPHLFGLPSSRKVDSSNRTHIPTISGIAANGSSVVDKIAKTTRMMCWYLLMVGITFCLDRAVHVPHGADACLTNSSFVDTFHVDPWNSRDNLEQRVQRNRVDLVQVGGQVTNPEDRTQLSDFVDTKHVMSNNTDLQQFQIERGGEQSWRSAGDRLLSSWSCRTRNHNLFWRMLQTWLGTSNRRGGRVFLTFPWKWNVLTTWPIQSVINEAPFLFAREKKRGILTKCVDTARLIGRSRCCMSLISQRLVQSSLANMFVSHEVYLWNVSIQEDSVCSCYLIDDQEATAFPSEADEAMREWRQEFPEQMRRAIIRIHTNLGHLQNSTLAKMISDAGGSEEMIKCATRYPCSVCKRMSRPRLRRPVSVPRTRQFNDTLLADVHFWNYQGREVLVYSLIDEATRFHVTQIVSSQSARDLYEAIMNAWVKWAGAPRFLLVDPHRSHLARQFIEQLGLPFLWELQRLRGPVVLWNVMEHMCDPWWRKWFTMECLMT